MWKHTLTLEQRSYHKQTENTSVSVKRQATQNEPCESIFSQRMRNNNTSTLPSKAGLEADVTTESKQIPIDGFSHQTSPLDLVSDEQHMVPLNDDSQFSALDFIEEFEDSCIGPINNVHDEHYPLITAPSASPQRHSKSAFNSLNVSSLPPSSDLPDSRSRSAVSPSLIWQTPTKGEGRDKASTQYKPEIKLLQQSDPWLALDEVLSISPSNKRQEENDDPYKGLDANDRRGVGFKYIELGRSNALPTLRPELAASSTAFNESDGLEAWNEALPQTKYGGNDFRFNNHALQDEDLLFLSSETTLDTLPSFFKHDAHGLHEKLLARRTQYSNACSLSDDKVPASHVDNIVTEQYYAEEPALGEDTQAESTKIPHDGLKEDYCSRVTTKKSPTLNTDNGYTFPRHEREVIAPSESQSPGSDPNIPLDIKSTNKLQEDGNDKQDIIIEGPQLFADEYDDDDDDDEI